ARIGDTVDRGDRAEREWELDPTFRVPEALAPVGARDGHTHLDRQGCPDYRQEEPERESDPTGKLRERRDPRPEDGRPQSHPGDALSPSFKARPAPDSKDFLRSVRRDDKAHNRADERDCQIGAD